MNLDFCWVFNKIMLDDQEGHRKRNEMMVLGKWRQTGTPQCPLPTTCAKDVPNDQETLDSESEISNWVTLLPLTSTSIHKSGTLLVFVKSSFVGTQSLLFIYLSSVATFVFRWQRRIVAAETHMAHKAQIFTTEPFTGKLCQPPDSSHKLGWSITSDTHFHPP